MVRGCKCTHCKNQLNTDIAYKVIINGRNKYYCNEEEYRQIQEEADNKNKCLETIMAMLNVPFIQPVMLKEINLLRDFYSYIVIEKAFKDNEQSILWFLENKDTGSEFGKIKYIMTIIKNNINSTFRKYTQEQKDLQKIFNKVESQEIDMDIMNTTIKIQDNDISDISQFLD